LVDQAQTLTVRMTQVESIGGDVRGLSALRHLIDPKRPGESDDDELWLFGSAIATADATTGAMLRANAEQHLAQHKDGAVSIWTPTEGAIWPRIYDLLGSLPDGCVLPDDHKAPTRDARVLLPAMRVETADEASLAALFLRGASQVSHLGPDRLNPVEAGYLATVLPELVDNGLRCGADSACSVIVCAALEADSRDVQLVVLDLGTAVSSADDSLGALRLAWRTSRTRSGSLVTATRLAMQRRLDISLWVKSGVAYGRWRGAWRTRQIDFSPGWCTGMTVHRSGRN
jgi:hypothetical protein